MYVGWTVSVMTFWNVDLDVWIKYVTREKTWRGFRSELLQETIFLGRKSLSVNYTLTEISSPSKTKVSQGDFDPFCLSNKFYRQRPFYEFSSRFHFQFPILSFPFQTFENTDNKRVTKKKLRLWKMAACFMKTKDSSGCGEFRGQKSLTSLLECTSDISCHLRRCHLSRENISEYQLILKRAGQFHLSEGNIAEMSVCPRHRGKLGAYWKCPITACQYPDHKGKQEAVKGDRVFNVQVARDIFQVFGVTIPIGSRKQFFCDTE